ncbi:MAG: HAD-IA family hydrolase, partial [Xanthobacteraceae bacterium]|nr:HAD-IA family hydrolase [Xanthobacteraceae bacterium]
ARFPEHETLILAWRDRFNETIGDPIPGVHAIVEELDASGVPLFVISNFSGEFWPPFRARESALFDRFRGFVISGDERLMKPDPAIYHLALDRFGLAAEEAFFVDDRPENVEAAAALGVAAHLFVDAKTLRTDLVARGLLQAA